MKTATILALFAAVAYGASTKVKATEADGHKHHSSRRMRGPPAFVTPVVDRNVCDLDASVLLVVEGGHRGYNKARRVKCADVAASDEDSCMVCCQQAARRDPTVRNEEIFGFLALVDGLDRHGRRQESSEEDSRDSHDDSRDEDSDEDSRADDYARRTRRQAAAAQPIEQQQVQTVEEQTVEETTGAPSEEGATAATDGSNAEYARASGERKKDLPAFKNDPVYKNIKCLCCAPRRQLPPPPIIAPLPVPIAPAAQAAYPQYAQQYQQPAAAPVYSQPAQAVPAYPAQSQPTYQQPAQAPQQYSAAQAPAAPAY